MMSNARNQLYRALLLRARDAARRFVPNRAKSGAHQSNWRPIVLRWRKRGRHLRKSVIGRAVSSTKFSSFPHFHFHFAHYQIQRTATNISGESKSSTRVFDTRIIRDQLRPNRKDSILSSRVLLDNHTQHTSLDLKQRTRTLRDFQPPHTSNSKSTDAHATQPELQRRSRFLFSRPPITNLRSFSPKAEVPSPVKTQSRVQQYWLLPHGTRSRNEENNRTDTGDRTRRSDPQFYRTEELVWRRVSRTTEINERVRHLETIEPSERPSVRSVSSQQTTVDVAHVMEQVAAMPITKLHPALIDRLANDVIRRVEQRVRIERERRGL